MEITSCLKSVLHSLNQYKHSTTDINLVHLQRQLEVLISITSSQAAVEALDIKDLVISDCIAAVISVINDPKHRAFLSYKIFILLHNLCASESIRQSFHESYHLVPTLASVLVTQPLTPSDVTVFMALKLLHRVAYNCRLSYEDGNVDELISVLVRYVLERETDLTFWCLAILANLCRVNPALQRFIKRTDQMKALYKRLVDYLTSQNQNIIVCTLSLLTSLCLHDPFGDKVFNSQNINQTFQVIFNILSTNESATTRRHTVDLFVDMLKHKRIQEALSGYDQLPISIKELLSVLTTKDKDAEHCTKVFELLLVFSQTSGVCTVLCKLLGDTLPKHADASYLSPFRVMLEWACRQPSGSDSSNMATLKAMELLKNIYEEWLDMSVQLTGVPHSTVVLPMLRDVLFQPPQALRNRVLTHHLTRCSLVLQMWTAMCADEELREVVCGLVGKEQMRSLLDFQIKNNSITVHGKTTKDPDDWGLIKDEDVKCSLVFKRLVGSNLVVRLLDLAYNLRLSSDDMNTLLCTQLQDPKLMAFLGHQVTRDSREHVQTALRLIQFACRLDDFPLVVLGDAITLSNCEHHTSLPAHTGFNDRLPEADGATLNSSSSISRLSHTSDVHVDGRVVENIIERFQRGMDLKDAKSSEIIALYEHQLQSLQTKEEHLQDLLDAKAMALNHADKLIAQYRARKAQADAEMNKLRQLLAESERSRDDNCEKLDEVAHDRDKLLTEVEHLNNENNRLTLLAEEHKELLHVHAELRNRADTMQHNLHALQTEKDTVVQMFDALQKHNDSLKVQHDQTLQQLTRLDEERKSMSRVIKEKESKLQEIDRSMKKAEEMLRRTQADKDEQEVALDKLRLELSRAEQHKKDLQHQLHSLELLCQKHEKEIRERDAIMAEQKLTIDKHAEIVAFIHNLSGGRAAVPTGRSVAGDN